MDMINNCGDKKFCGFRMISNWLGRKMRAIFYPMIFGELGTLVHHSIEYFFGRPFPFWKAIKTVNHVVYFKSFDYICQFQFKP
jgi:hypothetical protein